MSKFHDLALLDDNETNINLFYPYISESCLEEIQDTLKSRWIGQGPKVDQFETSFSRKIVNNKECVAVGAGTDALHLAYVLAGIKAGDEVICPVFTCTATNIPLLYQNAKVIFADIQKESLNIDPNHVKKLVSEKTKAIVCVDYGGLPADLDELKEIANEYNIPLIEDSCQAMGATYKGQPIGTIADYTVFSFQAIKHITSGDGGMLVCKNKEAAVKAKRLRWFGIDRKAKQNGTWDNDITEVGYKYQMTDLGASLLIPALNEFDSLLKHRKKLFNMYVDELEAIQGIDVVGKDKTDRSNAAWACTVSVENAKELQRKLREYNIESNQVHYRNDRYSIFANSCGEFPNMDYMEERYLLLPLHHKITEENIVKICSIIKMGW
ncbi:capsular polysaccharide biosynthesis protein [Anaerocolumna cellulosilytica]|uniref:Capsular polysaccharide biosynthesis protein n=1 Tax=Anaerocolumna cellulosilytica TaxID=433286 RepID=A0A6S6R444_9FIRM|nr:DegT/DnrJ/EryC1/StrS family aminotransferase [Anaerocolumna cellulosilytica]MBB5194867.1 dTDP-4-amino-4,6-dideoxygalactose transaminase [Anaerocolumna cellulosilytica]BCJ94170.1 capsular polysaccharide biosynthesis protein [Anaerocolumna cellulosilytica]